jgi:glycosyltransferase involved in cell wall biosynthesis
MSAIDHPRRVLLLVSDLEFGGAQRQVVELANHLEYAGVEAHVCSLAGYVPLANDLREHDRRLHVVRKHGKYDLTVVPRLARLLRQLRAEVLHTFLFDADFYGRLAGRLARVPAIVGSERNTDYVPLRRHLWAYVLTRAANDLTIANSTAGANFHARTFAVPRSRIRVVHNGVNTMRFSPRARPELRRQLGAHDQDAIVGMFASFRPEKNHALWLHAAQDVRRAVPQLRLLFAGDSLYQGMSNSVAVKAEVNQLVDTLDLRGCCWFVGNRPDIESFYGICEVTVLPSRYEGTPNVVLESMACGVPVVVSNVSDNAHLVPDGRAGYVVPSGDRRQLAERIGTLLTNEPLRRAMAKEARAWVVREFSGQRLAEKTLAAYRDALCFRAGHDPQTQ